MSDDFSPLPKDPRMAKVFRRLARIQGVLSWSILLSVAALSLIYPAGGAVLVVVFLGYFFLRSIHHAVFLIAGFVRFWIEEPSNWMDRIRRLLVGTSVPPSHVETCHDNGGGKPVARLRKRLRNRSERRTLEAMKSRGIAPTRADLERLVHLVIVPVYRESASVVEPALASLSSGSLDASRHVVLVLALEERSPEATVDGIESLASRYQDRFRRIITTRHPADVPGEVPGKASNEAFAARVAAGYLSSVGVSPSEVLVTVIDADAVPHHGFLGALTYQYLSVSDRERCLFQPLPVFDNNLWDVPSPVRLIEMMSTIFELVESTNVDGAVTFSSYSLSLATLERVGFWPVDVIAEDAAIYWRCFVEFDGDVRVIPVPTALSMDAVAADGVQRTLRNAYKQKLRWAYGAELFAPLLHAVTSRPIPVRHRVRGVVKMVENNTNWATLPFLLTLGPWLPRVGAFLNNRRPLTLLGLEEVTTIVFAVSGAFLLAMIVVSTFFGFRRERGKWWRLLAHPVEWFLFLPVSTLILSGVPALHAQTLLLFGKRLVYESVEKSRPA